MKNPLILIAAGDEVLRQDIKGRLSHHGFALTETPDKTDLLQCHNDKMGTSMIL